MQTTEQIVADTICDTLGVAKDKVKPESNLTIDLGADPLDIVEIILSLEERFNVHITEDESERFQTVGDIVEFLNQRCA